MPTFPKHFAKHLNLKTRDDNQEGESQGKKKWCGRIKKGVADLLRLLPEMGIKRAEWVTPGAR